jgi:hypothetical protein
MQLLEEGVEAGLRRPTQVVSAALFRGLGCVLDCGSMDADPALKLRLALDLFDTGEAMIRQRLRRLHPDWTPARIEEAVGRWLHERPGAEAGDSVGRPAGLAGVT